MSSIRQELSSWVEYIQGVHHRSIDLSLDRIAVVAKRLGIERIATHVITVTGTNGKGSNVATLESLALTYDIRCATFTSPHLVSFNERIRIDGMPVDDRTIVGALEKLERARQEISLTFFEFNALAAFLIFSQNNIELAILEVGMGGRLDATNIIDAQQLIITNIGLDHVAWLGETREEIGEEKAGLMRPGQRVYYGELDCPQSVLTKAKDTAVIWQQFGQDWEFNCLDDAHWRLKRKDEEALLLNKPALIGAHQLSNAATAVLAFIDFLIERKRRAKLSLINRALRNQYLPGRLDRRCIDGRNWLFEVGHNPDAINAVSRYLREQNARDMTCVITFLADKDATPMLNALKPYVRDWLGVSLDMERGRSSEEIAIMLTGLPSVRTVEGVEGAIEVLKNEEKEKNNIIVIGSFYLVGDIMRALGLAVYSPG